MSKNNPVKFAKVQWRKFCLPTKSTIQFAVTHLKSHFIIFVTTFDVL